MGQVSNRMSASIIVLLLAAGGCGNSERATVSGRVTDAAGAPVVGAIVIARNELTGKTATGTTDGEGAYELGGSNSGDGVLAGDYSVVVLGARRSVDGGGQNTATVPPNYASHETSGLRFGAQGGESVTFEIQLDAQ
jgi:hypothetical protein